VSSNWDWGYRPEPGVVIARFKNNLPAVRVWLKRTVAGGLGSCARIIQRGVRLAAPVNYGLLKTNIGCERTQDDPPEFKVGVFRGMPLHEHEGRPGDYVFKYARIVHEGRRAIDGKPGHPLRFRIREAKYTPTNITEKAGQIRPGASLFDDNPVRVVTGHRVSIKTWNTKARTAEASKGYWVSTYHVGPAAAHPFIKWGYLMVKSQIAGYLAALKLATSTARSGEIVE